MIVIMPNHDYGYSYEHSLFTIISAGGGQQYLASMDSNLEAFSRVPSAGRFVLIASRLATLTMYPNEVFLSY